MKKTLLSMICASLLISGCMSKESKINKDICIEGSIFSGIKEGRINTKLVFDDSWITTDDNNVFNRDLAKAASILNADCYFREKDLDKNNQNRVIFADKTDEYDYSLIFKELGFNNTAHIESFKQKEYNDDQNDSVTMNLAYKNVDDKYDTFIVVIRGCFSAGEWNGLFDCGAPDINYFNLTGKHSEWENTNVHKGIDVAVNRAKDYISEFVNEYDTNKPNTILLTGHSRGATIANILGMEYEEENYAKVYTYAFSPMKATLNPKDCSSIFNIFDSNDFFVDLIPFSEEKYERNGTDISIDIKNNVELQKKIAEIKDGNQYACVSKDFVDSYHALFAEMFKNRESLYIQKTIEKVFKSKIEAEEKYDEITTLIDSSHLGLDDIMSLSIIKEIDSEYIFAIDYYGASILRGLSKLLAYGSSVYDGLMTVFEDDKKAQELFTLLFDNLQDINGAHFIINDYFLVDQDTK